MQQQSEHFNKQQVESVIKAAVDEYFDNCRARVNPFVTNHFRYPGAWRTNKSALGWDLLRAPFNLFWAPVYVSAQLLAWVFGKLGRHQVRRLLQRTPSGLNTTVQTTVATLIASELLLQKSESPHSLKHIVLQRFDQLIDPEVHNSELLTKLDPVIEQALNQYGLTRTASADIANSLLATILGAFAFKKFTPGGIAIGLFTATWFAQHSAIESFFLGRFLGGIYYGVFPAAPSLGLNAASILLVLACLAVFASFSGLITDPIQSWTGLHRYRLSKMLKHIQQDVASQTGTSFAPKDPYVARILEILDAAKSQLL